MPAKSSKLMRVLAAATFIPMMSLLKLLPVWLNLLNAPVLSSTYLVAAFNGSVNFLSASPAGPASMLPPVPRPLLTASANLS